MSLENELKEFDFRRDFVVYLSYDSDGYEYWEMNKRGNSNSSVVLGYYSLSPLFSKYLQLYLYHEGPNLNKSLVPLLSNSGSIIRPDEQERLHFRCGDMMMHAHNFKDGEMNRLSLQTILDFRNANL